MKKGSLYCVGAGPGDPELITIKAQRVLQHCSVIAAPVTKGENTMALDIVREAVDISEKEILLMDFPMVSDSDILKKSHIEHADMLSSHLANGEDVAVVTIGDVSVYSTVVYVGDILKQRGYDVIMIPGVTSFCACACEIGQSLTSMRKPLHIFPAGFTDIEKALSEEGTKVFMKSGRQVNIVREKIIASGQPAYAVTDCCLDTQVIYENLADMPQSTGYFTTIIVKEKL